MPVFWGALSAVLVGSADLALIRSTTKASIVSVMVMVSVGGVVTAVLALAVIDSSLQGDDLLRGAIAGASMGAALALYVQSMRATSVSVTSPVVAVLNAIIPFSWGIVVENDNPSSLALVGVGVALISLVVTTISPESTGQIGRGLRFAVLSGLCYGSGGVLLGGTDESSGVWPAVTHRSAGVVMFLIVAAAFGLPRIPRRGLRASAFVAGALGTGALVAFLIGVQTGSLSLVAVSAGIFPAISVGLLYLFAGHPLRWWQPVGIAGAIAGVALIAVG
jgi:hypothetical protein